MVTPQTKSLAWRCNYALVSRPGPRGELIAVHRPPKWIRGGKERERRGGMERRVEERRGCERGEERGGKGKNYRKLKV